MTRTFSRAKLPVTILLATLTIAATSAGAQDRFITVVDSMAGGGCPAGSSVEVVAGNASFGAYDANADGLICSEPFQSGATNAVGGLAGGIGIGAVAAGLGVLLIAGALGGSGGSVGSTAGTP